MGVGGVLPNKVGVRCDDTDVNLVVFCKRLSTVVLTSFGISLKGRRAFDKYNNCKDVLSEVI